MLSFTFYPSTADASILSVFGLGTDTQAEEISSLNSQNVPLPTPVVAMVTSNSKDMTPNSGALAISDDAFISDAGPLGTQADLENGDIEDYVAGDISFYVVKKGDTVASVAKMFEVSQDTIRSANNLAKGASLKEGDTLLILPITGINYTIKKGDTLSSIAKTFQADVNDIKKFNGIGSSSALIAGETIVIPDGKLATPLPVKSTGSSGTTSGIKIKEGKIGSLIRVFGGADLGTYFIRPVAGGTRTQGIHQGNAVDIGGKLGTPVMAAAEGTVIVAKNSGYNYGYANYVVIQHPNGTQTLYAHLQKTLASVGQHVNQGDVIGLLGSTGHSTGPHLHFEVRGAENPLGDDPMYGLPGHLGAR